MPYGLLVVRARQRIRKRVGQAPADIPTGLPFPESTIPGPGVQVSSYLAYVIDRLTDGTESMRSTIDPLSKTEGAPV